MKFVLEINMGDDEMRTSKHVASALQKVAAVLIRSPLKGRKIMDLNGNSCGQWEFQYDEDDEEEKQ